MHNCIDFMPLGGGQNVGGSCYYMKLGNSNILLDAGIMYHKNLKKSPDFSSLLYSHCIEDLSQINQIYISHAHTDHMGYLPETMMKCKFASVFMTNMSYLLCKLQLYDREYSQVKNRDADKQLAMQILSNRIRHVSYLEKMPFTDYKVTFLQAGHIPGAMMCYFKYKNRNILYTGDYTLSNTALTEGCILPKDKLDILILCGLHAKHPNYNKENDRIYGLVKKIYEDVVINKKSVACILPQLSKGVEFVKMLCSKNKSNTNIYIDKKIAEVVNILEYTNIRVLDENCRLSSPYREDKPHIYIAANKVNVNSKRYKVYKTDFALHDNYNEIKSFIKKLNPKKTVIVHAADVEDETYTIEQDLLRDPDCSSSFIFAENGNMYSL